MRRVLCAMCMVVAACDTQASATRGGGATLEPPQVVATPPAAEAEAEAEPEAVGEVSPVGQVEDTPLPDQASGLVVVELQPSEGSLADQVRVQARRARAQGKSLYLEMGAPWCQPCKRVKALLARPEVQQQLAGVLLLRVDSDVFVDELDPLGFDAPTIPTFYALDAHGRPTDRTARGHRWKNAALVEQNLVAFLRDG